VHGGLTFPLFGSNNRLQEVAIDYNAALVSSAAALRHLTLTNQQV
jgi:hypothetical protein